MGVLQSLGRYWYQNLLCIQTFRKSLRQKFPSLPDEEDLTIFLGALRTTALAEFDKHYPSASVGSQSGAQLDYSRPTVPPNSVQVMPQAPGDFSNPNGITSAYLQSLLQGLTQSVSSAVGHGGGALSSGSTLSLEGPLAQVQETPQQLTSLSQTVPSTDLPGSIGDNTGSMNPAVSSADAHGNMSSHSSLPRPQMQLQGTPVPDQQQLPHSAAGGPQMTTPALSEIRPAEFTDDRISQSLLGSASFGNDGSMNCGPGLVGSLGLPMSFSNPPLLHTNPALTTPTLSRHPQTNPATNTNQSYGGGHLSATHPHASLSNIMDNVNGLVGNGGSLHGLNMAQLYALSQQQQQQRLLATRIQQAQHSSLHQPMPNAPTMLQAPTNHVPTPSNPPLHPALQQHQQQQSGNANHPSFVNLGLNSSLPPQSMQMLFQSSSMNPALQPQFMGSLGVQPHFLANGMMPLGEGYGHMLAQAQLNINPMCNTNQGTGIATTMATTVTTPSVSSFAGTAPTV
ncbi:hypothetical protein IWQ62_006381, partial [Dispira parvispora]